MTSHTSSYRPPTLTGWLALLLLALVPLTTGCASHARVRVTSAETGAAVRPDLPTRVYTYSDPNTVDIFLTDLPPEQVSLTSPTPGHLVHIHMFLRPSPGKTPIDSTATNATIRHLILTGGQTGIYAGGGFLLPKGDPTSSHFAGTINNASMGLLDRTPGFADLLGPSVGDIEFLARRDDALARRYQAALDKVTSTLQNR